MDWSTKKFHYKIVDDTGNVIGHVYKKLGELETFVNESNLNVKSLKRTGQNNFLVEVTKEKGWLL
jgi:hypothetical protein